MTDMTYVPLPGSERAALPQGAAAGSIDESEQIEVTVVTRRKADLPRTTGGRPARISRDELRENYGSDPADLALVARVLAGPDSAIEVAESDPATRRVVLSGPAGALATAFGTQLHLISGAGPEGAVTWHRYREGGLSVPAELDGIVTAVLGLDNRPQAQPRIRHLSATAQAPVSYTPVQVADAYGFPPNTTGAGQHVAILEFGGGFSSKDLDPYFQGLGITPLPSVKAVSVAKAKNVPDKDPSGADGEVLQDIEVVGAVAPGAAISVYFAPNSDQGFVEAVTAATHAHPTPAAISISWGESEDAWTAQARTSLDAAIADAVAIGITVTVAAGDSGSGDGEPSGVHCDFPASSPHALGCGGTSLQLSPAGQITAESVWNDGAGQGSGGGGISDVFPVPAWQADAGLPDNSQSGKPGRGVPDVSGNADPETGYQIRVDGQNGVIGGTSAVAPLWAALIARMAQAADAKFGLLSDILYAGAKPGQPAPGLRDITVGNNGAYHAAPGWDPCTGLGSPGTTLLSVVEEAAQGQQGQAS
jgi:kumamolisin